MSSALIQEQARRRIASACWAVLLLICLQYLFAFAWAGLHPATQSIGTTHPFTWSTRVNYSDLTDYRGKLGSIQSPALQDVWPVWNYPPTAAVVYYTLLKTSHPVRVFLCVVMLGLGALVIYFCVSVCRLVPPMHVRTVTIVTTVATALLSYPFQYVYWRANLEGIAFLLFASGLIAFCRRKNWLAAVLWALGIGIKPYSGLLFLLLLRRRQYRAVFFAALLFIVIQLPSLHIFAPSIHSGYRILRRGMQIYSQGYVHGFHLIEARFQHSIFDSMKAVCVLFGRWQSLASPEGHLQKWLFRGYLTVASLLGVSAVAVFWRKPYLNQCLAIITIVLLLAPVSADYTTIAMHMCWALVILWLLMDVANGSEQISQADLVALFTPFAILFAPQNWLSYYAGILHTAALFAFLIAAAKINMPSTLFGDRGATASWHPAAPSTVSPLGSAVNTRAC